MLSDKNMASLYKVFAILENRKLFKAGMKNVKV